MADEQKPIPDDSLLDQAKRRLTSADAQGAQACALIHIAESLRMIATTGRDFIYPVLENLVESANEEFQRKKDQDAKSDAMIANMPQMMGQMVEQIPSIIHGHSAGPKKRDVPVSTPLSREEMIALGLPDPGPEKIGPKTQAVIEKAKRDEVLTEEDFEEAGDEIAAGLTSATAARAAIAAAREERAASTLGATPAEAAVLEDLGKEMANLGVPPSDFKAVVAGMTPEGRATAAGTYDRLRVGASPDSDDLTSPLPEEPPLIRVGALPYDATGTPEDKCMCFPHAAKDHVPGEGLSNADRGPCTVPECSCTKFTPLAPKVSKARAAEIMAEGGATLEEAIQKSLVRATHSGRTLVDTPADIERASDTNVKLHRWEDLKKQHGLPRARTAEYVSPPKCSTCADTGCISCPVGAGCDTPGCDGLHPCPEGC